MSQDALDLLLSGVKDPGQRKQITSAYYAFANGDAETFAVQFAVLLRAHAMSLKLLPARLEKALAAATHKMGDLVIAHQKSVERIAPHVNQEAQKSGGGEGGVDYEAIQARIEQQLAEHAKAVKSEREKIVAAVAANGRLVAELNTHRILLGLILSYIVGLVTVPVFQWFTSLIGSMAH
ncbi:MAG: hypothetical protein WAK31_07230 [Chthoniobacterales bacterium]